MRSSDTSRWMVCALPTGATMRDEVGTPLPTFQQMIFAEDVCRELNRRISEGGCWVAAWCDVDANGVPTRLSLAWLDEDGDGVLTVEDEKSLDSMLKHGADGYCRDGDMAIRQYREQIKVTELKPHQRIKRARGQMPAKLITELPPEFA